MKGSFLHLLRQYPRLYDVLKEEFPDKFIYMLDTPRLVKEVGVDLYEQRIRAMIRAYEEFSGKIV